MKCYIDSWCYKKSEVHVECKSPMFIGETKISRVQKDGFRSIDGKFFPYKSIDNIVGPAISVVRKMVKKTDLDDLVGEKIWNHEIIDTDELGVAFKDETGVLVMVMPHDALQE